MAYYNPSSNSSYYDPYQNSQERTPSAIGAIGNAAKTLMLIGGLNLLGNAAANKLSGLTGRAIKQGVFGKNTRAYALAQNLRNPTIGGILKQTNSIKAAKKWFSSTAVGKANASRAQHLSQFKGTPEYGTQRLLSAFKSPATLAGAVGGTWLNTALRGAPVAYAVDSALGITTNELGLEKKAWYDVPGNIGNAAKWFAYESVYATAFGSMGVLGGAGKSLFTKGLQKTFSGNVGKYIYKTLNQVQGDPINSLVKNSTLLQEHNFFAKSINAIPRETSNHSKTFAAKVITSLNKMGLTARDTMRYTNRVSGAVGQAIKEGIYTPGSFRTKADTMSGPIKAALRNIQRIKARVDRRRTIKTSTVSSGGLKAAEFLTLLANKEFGGTVEDSAGLTLENFNKFFAPEFRKLQKKNVTDFVHRNLKHTKIKDIVNEDWVKDVQGSLSRKYAKGSVDQLMDQVLNMNVGTHIYHGLGNKIAGGGVNLAAFDPILTAKRALSFLTEHQWRVPLSNMKFSIGDLTGWNDMLAEKPDLLHFRDKPNFSLGLEYAGSDGKVTIGDLTNDPNALFVNVGSKWGIFDGEKIQTVDTGRALRYSRPSSKAKTREVDWIKRQRMIQKFGKAETEKLLAMKRRGQPLFSNKFLSWLNNRDISLPGLAQRALRALDSKLGGKRDAYMESVGKIFGDDTIASDTYRFLLNIDNILSHTSQVFSRILHTDEALAEIGEFSGSRILKKNLAETLWDDRSFADKYKALGFLANENAIDRHIRSKPELHEAIEKIKAFPKQAEQHIVTKRLGLGSDMNSYDVARVGLVDDLLNQRYWDELSGGGFEHPLGQAADSLLAKGIITEKEAKALKLHGKLSAFKDKSLFKFSGSYAQDAKLRDTVKWARDHAKKNNWKLQDELIDYISNNDLRSPHIAGAFEDILRRENISLYGDRAPYSSVPKLGIQAALEYGHGVSDTVGRLLEEISPFKRNPAKHYGLAGTARYIAKNAAIIGLTWQGYRVADALVASTPALDQTSLDQGITGFLSDNIAKARLTGARLADTVGLTSVAKYMEGLMPTSTSTFPGMLAGAAAGRFFGGGIGSTIAGMAWGGVINRLADPYLPDATKSYEELKEIYAGREMVPMMKSPTWLLGGTPWEGTKVQGFTPNWYVRAKSRWKETDTLYSSTFRKLIHEPIPLLGFNIGDIIDPYFMERLHYFDRPYPKTGEFGSEIPIIGKLVAPTIGRIIKPQKTMHQEFLADDWEREAEQNTYSFNNPPPTIQEHERMMNNGSSHTRSMGGRSTMGGTWTYGNNKNWADTYSRQFLMDVTNAAGLQGFLARSALEKTVGAPKVIPTLETAGRMASMARSYYDLNLGGMGVLCLPKGETVLTPNGLVFIENCKVGDVVISDNYEEQYITHTGSRLCNKNEKLYTITIGAGKTLIRATEAHPVAIYKRVKCSNNHNRPCIPNYSKKCKSCSKRDNSISWNWVDAQDINIGDFVVQPLPKENKNCVIDLGNYTNRGVTDNYIYYGSTEFAKAYELLEKDPTLTRSDLRKYVEDKYAKEALYSFRHNNIKRQKRYIYIDEDLAWFIGWWLAEGSSNGKAIKFTLNINEINIARKLGSIFVDKQLGSSYSILRYPDKNACVLNCCNLAFSSYLKSFGNVYSKSLNDLIHLPDKQAIKLCQGYISGDGWLNYRTLHGGVTSVSSRLIRDMWLLLYRLGVQSTITIDYNEIPNNQSVYPQGTNRKETIRSYLKFNKKGFSNLIRCFDTLSGNGDVSTGRTFTNGGYLYIKIVNISSEDYSHKEVFDISISNTHSFIGNYALLHNSEPIRRLIEKPEYARHGINPIPNMMPNWLPERFLKGDPYAAIQRGELRLPGRAYESTHTNIKQDMPGRASMIGGDLEHIVQYFTGLLPPVLKEEYDILETGTAMHEIIQDQLAAENLLVEAETFVVDVENDITGHVDAIVRDGRGGCGKRALEIKTISQEGFERLDAPKWQHVGQLNFYLKQLRMNEGSIMYVMRDNPAMVKTFDVHYSQTRWEQDLRKLQQARQVAADMMQQGVGDKYGYSYSWLDRLNILADVAPTSNEFKEAKKVVELQIRNDLLTEKDITKYKKALKHRQTRLRKYELYPLRFKGQVMSPDTERNIQSINENIKAGAEYGLPSRIIGSLWERFTNTNFFVINKLWHVKDPLEHYKLTRLYGKEFKPWDEPYRGWIEPLSRGLASKTDPATGALGWATTGMVAGGPAGSLLGAVIGAGYGTVNGLTRSISGQPYIPGTVKDQREIEEFFDAAKYIKNQRLSALSNGLTSQNYNTISQATLHAFNQGEGGDIANLFRATPTTEKPYIESWLNERDPNRRKEILSYIPDNLANALKKQWDRSDQSEFIKEVDSNNSSELAAGGPNYRFDASIFDPSIELEDIKLRTIEKKGFDAHEFGLGWNEQQLRMLQYQNDIQAADIQKYSPNEIVSPNINQGQIKMSIINALKSEGIYCTVNVFVNNYNNTNNVVNIIIKRDRSRSIEESLHNRDKWM